MSHRRPILVMIFAAVAFCVCISNACHAVDLPQDHEYQRVLRDYLATLAASDFAVPLEAVTIRGQADDEQVHRLWLLTRSIPSAFGLTIPATHFLLDSIESPDGIRIRTGRHASGQLPGFSVLPEDTVWWSTWNVPGNPYRDSRAVRHRAFVIAAVDMIMLDKLHESGNDWVRNARRSDFLGGTLIWLTYVYHHVRDDLPGDVQEAYETGLEKFIDRLTEWGPTGVNDNMDTKALVAAAYVSRTFGEGPLVDKARGYSHRVLQRIHPAGMIRDSGGLEASYNGYALLHVAWAAAVGGDPRVIEAERRMTILKAHLTLPEPDRTNFTGPSHFSSRTGADAANDQASFPPRDFSIAMRHDEAMYLMHGGRSGRTPLWGAPDRQTMLEEIRIELSKVNASLKPTNEPFATWEPGWWGSEKMNFAYDHATPGFYHRVRRSLAEGDEIILPPLLRSGPPFVRVFPDPSDPDVKPSEANTFVIGRFPSYTAIVSAAPQGPDYMNFPGGGLSAFWTPSGGSIVLGRSGNPVEPANTHQTWSDWRLWPTHALSGQTASGDAFSSARVAGKVTELLRAGEDPSVTLTIRTAIGKQHDKGRSCQNGCIGGDVLLERTFIMGQEGVEVETRLESDGRDRVTDLCEIVPLYGYDAATQNPTPDHPGRGVVPHRVGFLVGANWVAPPSGFVDDVTAVAVRRFDGEAFIVFETPQRVRLGEEWSDDYESQVVMRNVIIDLIGNRGGPVPLPDVVLRYRIEPRRNVVATPKKTSPWRTRSSPPAERGRSERSRR